MPRFSANLSTLFTDRPFLDRVSAAAGVGFKAVEVQFPYHLDRDAFGDALAEYRLSLVLCNAPPGDWEAGERGLAALPGREEEFRDGLDLAFDWCNALKCQRLHVMAGIVDLDDPDVLEDAYDAYLRNIAYAAAQGEARGVKVLIEPINGVDMPGYFLQRPDDAVRVLDEVDHRNLFLQYDLYHAQMTQGGLTDFLEGNLHRIAHMQVAGVPGRHEPDANGEINFPYLFNLIDAHGYAGWIGCEYRPRINTIAGLRWAREWGIGQDHKA
ncbi:2-oxo-tetronate isomerase [Caenispirillum bisanense]|uniref:Hydroxypyruvate isomerase n=1 Tax=Caenispirillum bisanense TaxID=414052 RepID=A0A286G4I2_9PROT|nr:2-oxo-tetronate isomerase [Caenispirillum bisanense]SOD90059.1 hydroxypyruvate isomerase [Caenispirillum bisanense]